MNEISTSQLVVNRSGSSGNEENLLNGLKANVPSAFAALYDQYAPTLFGVITKIIRDENEAILLLEATFIKIHSQINDFQPAKQVLFTWLLSIARGTALEALKNHKSITPSGFQLTTSDQVTISNSQPDNSVIPTNVSIPPPDSQLKELLEHVLFKNCTLEEAAASVSLPVEAARQQLRVAMQQLRASQKA